MEEGGNPHSYNTKKKPKRISAHCQTNRLFLGMRIRGRRGENGYVPVEMEVGRCLCCLERERGVTTLYLCSTAPSWWSSLLIMFLWVEGETQNQILPHLYYLCLVLGPLRSLQRYPVSTRKDWSGDWSVLYRGSMLHKKNFTKWTSDGPKATRILGLPAWCQSVKKVRGPSGICLNRKGPGAGAIYRGSTVPKRTYAGCFPIYLLVGILAAGHPSPRPPFLPFFHIFSRSNFWGRKGGQETKKKKKKKKRHLGHCFPQFF